jgi:hypothetical protein
MKLTDPFRRSIGRCWASNSVRAAAYLRAAHVSNISKDKVLVNGYVLERTPNTGMESR